jgi:hypothetical protein
MGFRRLCILTICGIVIACGACEKKKIPETVAPIDRVGDSPTGTSQDVLHKTFTLKTTNVFSFEIPAHAAMPHLRGDFKSYVTRVGIQSNEHSADIDFMIFSEQQYAQFAAGSAGEAVFSNEPSHDQTVDVNLPPSFNEGAKYYLVFRNTPGGDSRKTVQTDLRVDF